ncbi:MAG: hypothetical protein QOD86_939 [Miltoncostaeaceae bacterium]|nr:hypothetical protein [Miltoncostaeaceae bacterium]
MGAHRRLTLDLQAAQSRHHAERGIARYVAEHAAAIERVRPGLVDRFLLNQRFTLPPGAERLLPTGRVGWSQARRAELAEGPLTFHAMSPFEMTIPLAELWPLEVRRPDVRLVVTLYDLIPLIFPDVYLSDPITRARYRSRLEMVRAADRVLAISEATARDAVRLLNIPREKVRAIGTGVSGGFRPPARPAADVVAELRESIPDLREGFFLYTGGIDFRKNIELLIGAYGDLPQATRDARQLVITCKVLPDEAAHLREVAARAGAAGDVLLTGFVPDEVLRGLYGATRTFVFPSLYEGFGLPVAEAMRCGAPVLASNLSSLPELVRDPEALFDPRNRTWLTALLARAADDDAFVDRLRARAPDADRFTWEAVAAETVSAYRSPWTPPRPAAPRRPQLAMVTPFPPQLSGIARYSAHLVDQLVAHADVDVFVDGDPAEYDPPSHPACRIRSAASLERRNELVRYDAVLHCMGNSSFHDYVLRAMRRVPGHVLAHDVRLARFYEWRAWEDGEQLAGRLAEMYGARISPESFGKVPLMPADAERFGIWMTGELSTYARRVLVHSRLAESVVRLEAEGEGRRVDARVLPFAFPPAPEDPLGRPDRPGEPPQLVSFGVVDAVKRVDQIVAAMPAILARHPGARLALVGPIEPWEERRVTAIAQEAGVSDAIRLTGAVTDDAYHAWLRRADIALQMRQVAHGEASATVTETLASGIPTIVTDIGWMGDLPAGVAVKLPPTSGPGEIAAAVLDLLERPEEWRRLGLAGAAHAARNGFARTAEALMEILLEPDAGGPVDPRTLVGVPA